MYVRIWFLWVSVHILTHVIKLFTFYLLFSLLLIHDEWQRHTYTTYIQPFLMEYRQKQSIDCCCSWNFIDWMLKFTIQTVAWNTVISESSLNRWKRKIYISSGNGQFAGIGAACLLTHVYRAHILSIGFQHTDENSNIDLTSKIRNDYYYCLSGYTI